MNKIYALFFFALFFVSAPARADPWIVTGQTKIPIQTGIDNPVPSDPGALGQVTELPYEVPPGCVLAISAYGIEGYDVHGITVIFLWTGDPAFADPEWRISHGTASAAAKNGSNELLGQNLQFPERTIINVRLINGTWAAHNWVFGWYVSGDLTCN